MTYRLLAHALGRFAFSMVLFTGVAHAKDRGFVGLDKDGDNKLSRAEVREAAKHVIKQWDADASGRLEEVEFILALFRLWDADGNKKLSATEFRIGHILWNHKAKTRPFSAFDKNRNGSVSETEFEAAARRIKYFQHYDQNGSGRISRGELAGSMMQTFDENRDGHLGENEWPIMAVFAR